MTLLYSRLTHCSEIQIFYCFHVTPTYYLFQLGGEGRQRRRASLFFFQKQFPFLLTSNRLCSFFYHSLVIAFQLLYSSSISSSTKKWFHRHACHHCYWTAFILWNTYIFWNSNLICLFLKFSRTYVLKTAIVTSKWLSAILWLCLCLFG